MRDFLSQAAGVRLLVDESVEERESRDWAENLERKKQLLHDCRDSLGDSVRFVPLKARRWFLLAC